MKRRQAQHAISDDEQIARYAYVLGNVPTTVADRAYAAAFARLSATQRTQIVGQLRAELPEAPQEPPPDDPNAFAVLMRNLHARAAMVRIPLGVAFAAEFVASPPIAAYFTTGAGSVTMDHQPPWIHALAGHETAPIDGGTMQHRRGANSGDWFPV